MRSFCRLALILALLLTLGTAPAWAAVTCSTTTDIVQTYTTTTALSTQFAASVSAGSFGIYAISTTTNETATVSVAPSDGTNTWTLLAGPIDHASTTLRTWYYYAENMGAGQHTVTATLSEAVSGRVVMATCLGGTTTLRLDAYDTDAYQSASSDTHGPTDAVTASAARDGVVFGIGLLNTSTGVSSLADGNETNLTGVTDRGHVIVELIAASGAHTIGAITYASIGRGNYMTVIALEEAAGGSSACHGMLLGVGCEY